jgi:hypothetical protein
LIGFLEPATILYNSLFTAHEYCADNIAMSIVLIEWVTEDKATTGFISDLIVES